MTSKNPSMQALFGSYVPYVSSAAILIQAIYQRKHFQQPRSHHTRLTLTNMPTVRCWSDLEIPVWGRKLSARERLECRMSERRRWQQEELPPITLEDIDDTCEVFQRPRMLRRLRCSSRSLPVALRKVIQGGWI